MELSHGIVSLSQRQMEKKLSVEAGSKELWRIIKAVVKSGNCLVDDGDEIKLVKSVKLAADSKGLVKAFLFKV